MILYFETTALKLMMNALHKDRYKEIRIWSQAEVSISYCATQRTQSDFQIQHNPVSPVSGGFSIEALDCCWGVTGGRG
jgi:hypothetical protein